MAQRCIMLCKVAKVRYPFFLIKHISNLRLGNQTAASACYVNRDNCYLTLWRWCDRPWKQTGA